MLVPKTRGLTEFTKFIDKMARNMRGIATEEITDYVLGNAQRGLRHYPPKRGQSYTRTFTLRGGWIRRGQGVQSRAENTIYYVEYVQGDNQAWWTQLYGWRHYSEIVASNMKGATRAAELAIIRKAKER